MAPNGTLLCSSAFVNHLPFAHTTFLQPTFTASSTCTTRLLHHSFPSLLPHIHHHMSLTHQDTKARHSSSSDLNKFRPDFPILDQLIHNNPLIYLDSAATSQKPTQVVDTLTKYYNQDNSNVHRGAHSLSARATAAYEGARDKVQNLINAQHRQQIIFTRNATEAINLVAYSWALTNLKQGDEIILSVMEHHSNFVPWQIIAKKTGAVLKHVGLTPSQEYDLDMLKSLVSKKTKLIACNYVSNMLGCINPVKEIVQVAHTASAKVLIDACQAVPHMTVDVQDIDCDWLVASGHKMCGPSGIGFLYGKLDLLESMDPFMGGGEMIADVYLDHSTYAMLPSKFEAGTPAIAEAIGLGAAIDYLQSIGMDRIHDIEIDLSTYLYEKLSAYKEIFIYGPKAPRAALCAFNVDGVHPSDLATIIDLEGVAIRSGHHCTQPLHRHLGIDASARASLYFYNSKQEIDKFIQALETSVTLLGGSLTRKD